MIKKILLWAIIIVIVGLIVAYFARNYLVKKAIEEGSTYALGVETELGSASLSITAGSLDLSDYRVHNPDGFEGDNILTIASGMVDVATGSLLQKEVEIDSLVLDGLSINLVQNTKAGNYAVIMDNIKKVAGGGESESQQRFHIGKIAIRDINVSANLNLLNQKEYHQDFAIDNITLTNVGGDNGATLGQVAGKIMQKVLARAVAEGSNRLPGEFGKYLGGSVDETLQNLGSDVKDKLKDLGLPD